ncbi:MAG TPA: hypothetical protein VMD52_08180 [Patescibacteria group bacterium]|nr:hypothetical protein [Patescibacteria group bacterium]
MKKTVFFIVVCLVLCGSLFVLAQNNQEQAAPDGMEYIQVSNGYKILVPKGMKLIPVGSYERVEKLDTYVARRFEEMDKRLKEIETGQAQMQGELAQLKAAVAELRTKIKE